MKYERRATASGRRAGRVRCSSGLLGLGYSSLFVYCAGAAPVGARGAGRIGQRAARRFRGSSTCWLMADHPDHGHAVGAASHQEYMSVCLLRRDIRVNARSRSRCALPGRCCQFRRPFEIARRFTASEPALDGCLGGTARSGGNGTAAPGRKPCPLRAIVAPLAPERCWRSSRCRARCATGCVGFRTCFAIRSRTATRRRSSTARWLYS